MIGAALIGIALLSLIGSRWHPLQRAVISIRLRTMLGHVTEVTIGDDGVRYTSPLGQTMVPWSSMTDVRANDRTVAFFRDAVIVGYIPAEAFASPAQVAAVADLAAARVAVARPSGP